MLNEEYRNESADIFTVFDAIMMGLAAVGGALFVFLILGALSVFL